VRELLDVGGWWSVRGPKTRRTITVLVSMTTPESFVSSVRGRVHIKSSFPLIPARRLKATSPPVFQSLFLYLSGLDLPSP
jgi:hypothetical protein